MPCRWKRRQLGQEPNTAGRPAAHASLLTLTFSGVALQRPVWNRDRLYRPVAERSPRPVELRAIPYYAWGNRGDTEMSVWLPAR